MYDIATFFCTEVVAEICELQLGSHVCPGYNMAGSTTVFLQVGLFMIKVEIKVEIIET